MTEAEWLTCPDPLEMLVFLAESMTSVRKKRLFAVACCDRISHLLTDKGSRAVRAAEQFADGRIDRQEMRRAWTAVGFPKVPHRRYAAAAARAASCSPGYDGTSHGAASAVEAVASEAGEKADLVRIAEQIAQAELLRDIFNPLHPVTADPSWLASNVIFFAQGIYEGYAFEPLPIFADALEEAGCTDTEILSHCRGPGPHVRGCWVVDLILGKA